MVQFHRDEIQRVRVRILKVAPLSESEGAVESDGVKLTCPEVFVEVLRNRRRFLEKGG